MSTLPFCWKHRLIASSNHNACCTWLALYSEKRKISNWCRKIIYIVTKSKVTCEKYEVCISSWFKDNILGCVGLRNKESGCSQHLPLAVPRSTMCCHRCVPCATLHALLGLRLGLPQFKNLPKGIKPVHTLAGRWVYLSMFLPVPSNKNQSQALSCKTFEETKVSQLMTRISHVSSSFLWSYRERDRLQESFDNHLLPLSFVHITFHLQVLSESTLKPNFFYK